MLELLIDVTDPQQNGILDTFLSPGAGIEQDFVRGDKSLAFSHRPVKPSITNVRPWDDDHLASDTYEVSIGLRDTPPTGGDWPLTIGAQTVNDIPYAVTAAALQTSLSTASTAAGYGNVTVTLLATGVYQVVWNSNGAVPAMTSGTNDLSPDSTVTIIVDEDGTVSSQAIQLVVLRQLPVAYAAPTTQLTAAAIAAAVAQAGSGSANKRYTLTMTAGTYGGTFSVTVTAATGSAETLAFADALITAEDFETLLLTHSVLVLGDVIVGRVGDVLNVEFTGTQKLSNTPVIAVTNIDLLAPKGVSGTINLNTVNLYRYFWSIAATTMTATFTMAIRRTRTTGEEAEYFLHDVTLKRNLIDVTTMVPLSLPEFYTKTQSDARYAQINGSGDVKIGTKARLKIITNGFQIQVSTDGSTWQDGPSYVAD